MNANPILVLMELVLIESTDTFAFVLPDLPEKIVPRVIKKRI